MIEPESYKSRVVEVRRSARAHVLEIRRARIAKRQEALAGTGGAPMAEDTPVPEEVTRAPDAPLQSDADLADDLDDMAARSAAMEEGPAPADSVTDQTPDTAPVTETLELDTIPSADAQSEKDASGMQSPESPTESSNGQTDTSPDEASDMPTQEPLPAIIHAESPSLDAETDSTADDTADASASAAEAVPGDLEKLPGAGPGLVWMLNQCGIQSLADLAAQEAAALSPKLGVVGQILDVEKWIAFAREQEA